jgi:glycerol-3-phosphate dehydrogenase subunit B
MTDTIVIGAGLAGLTASIRLAESGQSVTLLSFGEGGLSLSQGTIDVLGYIENQPVDSPLTEMSGFIKDHPNHPYATVSPTAIAAAISWFTDQTAGLLQPSDETNHFVPTALGAMRPTYLVPPSMVFPDVPRFAVVGIQQIKDFSPGLIAENLTQTAKIQTRPYWIELPARPGEVDSSPVHYAQALDNPDFLSRFVDKIVATIGDEDAVLLPAILGLHTDAHSRLTEALQRPVVEVIMAPPSIPGIRLKNQLVKRAKNLGVRVVLGSKVTGFTATKDHITSVTLHQAGRDQTYSGDNVIYGGGGFESGALVVDSYGKVRETLFDLPLAGADRLDLITGDYWKPQPLFEVGVIVDPSMRVVDPGKPKKPIYHNLYVVGGLLAGAQRWIEKSGDGIAIASAYQAAESILGGDRS